MIEFLDLHPGVTAAVSAGTAAGAWICTVVADIRGRRKLHEIHIQINSRLDQTIKAAKELGRVEGFAAGLKARETETKDH